MEVTLSPIPVMFVFSKNGTAGASAAFDVLEKKLPNLKKRRFYGVLEGSPETGIYRACIGIMEGDDPKVMGLDTWTIPGGKYARAKIANWNKHLKEIGPTFDQLKNQYKTDPNRPLIEYYRSDSELLLFLPIQ
jgi:DNA gyrase inhibitor GyrI